MNEGHFTRHLSRMRRLYAERRQYFLDAAERHLGAWLDFHGTESGIQLVGLFRDECDDARYRQGRPRHKASTSRRCRCSIATASRGPAWPWALPP